VAEIVDKLNKEVNAGLGDPEIKARLVELGGTVLSASIQNDSGLPQGPAGTFRGNLSLR
jgi:hypothetical protein